MVLNDRQFTVFCREVGFVKIYAFLVLFFLTKYVSLLFLLLFPSLVTITINLQLSQILTIAEGGGMGGVQEPLMMDMDADWMTDMVVDNRHVVEIEVMLWVPAIMYNPDNTHHIYRVGMELVPSNRKNY